MRSCHNLMLSIDYGIVDSSAASDFHAYFRFQQRVTRQRRHATLTKWIPQEFLEGQSNVAEGELIGSQIVRW